MNPQDNTTLLTMMGAAVGGLFSTLVVFVRGTISRLEKLIDVREAERATIPPVLQALVRSLEAATAAITTAAETAKEAQRVNIDADREILGELAAVRTELAALRVEIARLTQGGPR